MSLSEFERAACSLAVGALLLIGLLLVLNATPQIALADPADLFVATDGSGTACVQADPCDLATGLSQSGVGDAIYVAQGTYTGTGTAVITITNSITLYGGWDGAPSGAVVRDPNTYETTLDGEGQRRVVYISGDIDPTIDGFIITGGNASGLAVDPYGQNGGGGICSVDADPIIANNVITHNLASTSTSTYGRGGGIHLVRASAKSLISGNVIISNTASTGLHGYGGGISTYASYVTIQGNQVLSNMGSTVDYGSGGGIHLLSGAPCVIGNELRGNTGSLDPGNGAGGGISLEQCDGLIEGNLIESNEACSANTGRGGGISVHSISGAPTLRGNRVLSNTARYGGGLDFFGDDIISMTNSIIARNLASTQGGGIVFRGVNDSSVLGSGLYNNTIADNGSQAIYLNQHAIVTLTNNIIVSHAIGIYASAGTTATADHSLFFGNTTADITGPGATSSTAEITGSVPLFIEEAEDYHIRLGSPAIDVGASLPWLTSDIDGDPRPWPSGGAFDIGADEVRSWVVYLPLVLRQN
jgi:hypothetical protein